VRGGRDVAREFPEFLTHLRNCPDCGEDAESLLAIIEQLEKEARI
jgi:hypothetical protein